MEIREYNNKVINIKTEILFREAEDDFYYFNKSVSAIKKLKEGLMLTPCHRKSLILAGDIEFTLGHIKKAEEYYKRAEKISSDAKVLASLANCSNMRGYTQKAYEYCNKALKTEIDNTLLKVRILELKTEILLKTNRYEDAYNLGELLKYRYSNVYLSEKEDSNFKILYNRISQFKRLKSLELQIITEK